MVRMPAVRIKFRHGLMAMAAGLALCASPGREPGKFMPKNDLIGFSRAGAAGSGDSESNKASRANGAADANGWVTQARDRDHHGKGQSSSKDQGRLIIGPD